MRGDGGRNGWGMGLRAEDGDTGGRRRLNEEEGGERREEIRDNI